MASPIHDEALNFERWKYLPTNNSSEDSNSDNNNCYQYGGKSLGNVP